MTRIPSPALVVLVGASGSGKSTWAEARFGTDDRSMRCASPTSTRCSSATTPQGCGRRSTASRGRRGAPEYAAAVNAAAVDDHVDRFGRFADAGVGLCVVSLPDVGVESVGRFGRVIEAFAS